MSRALGITDKELLALRDYRDSDAFNDVEKLAIELAEAMTRTPAEVPDRLRTELREHFTRGQLTELASGIAWENHRARINRALGVREAGFSDGAFCLVPER